MQTEVRSRFNYMKSLLMLGSVMAMPAYAQTTEASPPVDADTSVQNAGVEEIVVTAQKREQSLQDVPISISALNRTAIEANRIQDVRDLSALAPNLTIRLSGGGAQIPNYTLRGLFTTGAAAGTDKGVALYLDGVYIQNVVGSVFDFADIERIEVLKGPQGTLFGRNATGGAISITTRNPSGEFSARQDFSYGNYNQLRSKTRVDLPQFGPFSVSGTYLHSERRGDVRNLGAGTVFDSGPATNGRLGANRSPRRLGDDNVEAFAGAIKADLLDDLDLVYKYDYSENDYTPNAQGVSYLPSTVNVGGRTLPSIVAQLYAASPNPMTPVTEKRPKAVNNAFTSDARLRTQGHNFTAGYRLNDQISFKNILAYRKTSQSTSYQLDGLGGLVTRPVDIRAAAAPLSPVPIFAPPGVLAPNPALRTASLTAPFVFVATNSGVREHQWSNEFQINIDTDWFTVTAGYLHFYDKVRTGAPDTVLNTLNITAVNGQQTAAAGTPFVQPGNPGYGPAVVTVKSDAWFVQPEFHITPELDIVGGARITKDRKSGFELFPDQTLVGGSAARPISTPIRYRDSQDTFLVGVNYRPTQDALLYAKYADGYVSGGQLATIPFAPEKAYSYEAGTKLELFDRRLRSNLAVFYVDYKNVQNTTAGILTGVPSAAAFSQAVVASADARAYGFEWENTLVPVRGITLTANVGYTNFKFDQDTVFGGTLPNGSVCRGPTCTGGFVAQSGANQYEEFQRPRWTGNLSAQYDSEELFSGGHLVARVDASFRSKTLMTSDLTLGSGPGLPQDAGLRKAATVPFTWLVNGRLGVVDMDLGFTKGSIAVWGKNIFDNRQMTQLVGLDLGPLGYIGSVIYERARTYGIDVSFAF